MSFYSSTQVRTLPVDDNKLYKAMSPIIVGQNVQPFDMFIENDTKINSFYEKLDDIKINDGYIKSNDEELEPCYICDFIKKDKYKDSFPSEKYIKLALTSIARLYWNENFVNRRKEYYGDFESQNQVADLFIKKIMLQKFILERTTRSYKFYKKYLMKDERNYWEKRVYDVYKKYASYFVNQVLKFNEEAYINKMRYELYDIRARRQQTDINGHKFEDEIQISIIKMLINKIQ